MPKKLQQTSLDQTGMAILYINGEEKHIPLFSLDPYTESEDMIQKYFPNCEKFKVYVTNNLLLTPIEDTIEDYCIGKLNLPEDYMEELLSGFPYIVGREPAFKKAYYA